MLARNAVFNLVGEGSVFLVLLVSMPKLVHFLGETSFGLFSLAWVIIGYLAFLDIGVSRAATKFVSEHLAEQNHSSVLSIVRTALLANLVLGLLGACLVMVAAPYVISSVLKTSPSLEGQAHLTFYVVALSVPVLLVQGVLRAVLSSFQRFDWINGVNVLTTAAQWTAAAILAWKGHGVAVVVLATVLARIVATLVYGVVLFRLLPGLQLFKSVSFGGLLKLMKFGTWVSVSQLVSPVLVYLDRILIASFVSLSAVTLYTVPYEIMTRLRVIPSSVATTLYPAFSERGTEKQRANLDSLYEGSVRYLLLLLIPGVLFLSVLGPDLMTLWMGASFAQHSAVALQVLAFGVLANGMAYVPYNVLQALGRPDLTGKFHLLELPFYVLLCVLLIPRWGITGAAFASTVRFTLDCGLLFWAAGKYCGCSPRAFWTRSFSRLTILALALSFLLTLLRVYVNPLWARLGMGVIAIGIYILLAGILTIDVLERPKFTRAARMLLGRFGS